MADGRTRYSKLRDMLLTYYQAGYTEISLVKLENLIIKNIGSAPRTLMDSLRVMGRTKLIEDIGNARFRIVRMNLE